MRNIIEIGDRVTVINPQAKYAGRVGLVMGRNRKKTLVIFRDQTIHPYSIKDLKNINQ